MTTSHAAPDGGAHRHAGHDRHLIAALAAGDLVAGGELARATALLATCGACRTLHEELRAIAAATRTLPPSARPTALDFRIGDERAAALRRGSLLRRLLRPFGRRGGAVRPLALTFSTLGIAGLLLAALPSMPLAATFLGGAAGGSAEFRDSQAESAGPGGQAPEDLTTSGPLSPAGGDTSGGEAAAPSPETSIDQQYHVIGGGKATGGSGSAGNDGSGPGSDDGDAGRTADRFLATDGPDPLVLLSVGFLGAGIGLLLLRRAALRLR